jgi:hypothetical protein
VSIEAASRRRLRADVGQGVARPGVGQVAWLAGCLWEGLVGSPAAVSGKRGLRSVQGACEEAGLVGLFSSLLAARL